MSKHVVFHVLRHVGPGAVNRDKQGNLKSITIGGEIRSRYSSQTFGNSIREFYKKVTPELVSIQTRQLTQRVMTALMNNSIKEEEAKKMAIALMDNFLGHNVKKKEKAKAKKEEDEKNGKKSKEKEKDETLAEVSRIFPEELAAIDKAASDLATGIEKDPAKIVFMHEGIALDLAMKGRMRPTHIRGAFSLGESYGICRQANEEDYFTARDDFQTDPSEGAAHQGYKNLAADNMYVTVMIDVDLLRKNLPNEKDLEKIADKFIDALYFAGPSSSSTNGSQTHTPPAYMMMEVLDRQPLSYNIAFEQSVSKLSEGVKRLQDVRDKVAKDYPQPLLSMEYGQFFEEGKTIEFPASIKDLKDQLKKALLS